MRSTACKMYSEGISESEAFSKCMQFLGCGDDGQSEIQIDGHTY
jgi:hypothetical protein